MEKKSYGGSHKENINILCEKHAEYLC